ncbi:hypothetical protein CERSUDRAFT_119146 [Gelatoporia subvermispora B]|uniref:Amidase domain-containing protein n=1 Tax=Ceriporiopsis subvermispora (strain B) TaxID=914234 RepID=M2QIF6_CERS8|nr:hypothetical protein CERSUDRAFT_119146 [Gelatoporia subvermispora B]
MFLSYFDHRRDCAVKREERKAKFDYLPPLYSTPTTDEDRKILALSLERIVSECNARNFSPSRIINAYGRRCIQAQVATNCLSDIMFDEAEYTYSYKKSLSGVPISLKDCVDIAGHDSTMGYSCNVGRPKASSAPIVRLLQDAGALIIAKTTVPTGLLSFETISDLFGETTNPYNPAFSAGASSGGGSALLAYGGSVVDIGTDVGGSVRFPAAYCGLYAVKSSIGRFPGYGCASSTPGMQGTPPVTAPLARRLEDLAQFWRRVVDMKPWEYDHSCVPLPWRPVDFVVEERKPRWGVMWDDGLIPPTPACARALAEVADVLRRQGHEVVEFVPPSPLDGYKIGYQLIFSDGAVSVTSRLRTSEFISPALRTVRTMLLFPLFVKIIWAFLLRILSRPFGRNEAWASLLEGFHPKTVSEERNLISQRESYRAAWHRAWQEQNIDFVLTVPHALPPMPRGGSATATLVSAEYAFLHNVLDTTAGIVPVTFVDKARDALPQDFHDSPAYQNLNDVARGVYSLYDADAMHGLPLAVQVVGRRFEEEKVLEGMKVIEASLYAEGRGFVQKEF